MSLGRVWRRGGGAFCSRRTAQRAVKKAYALLKQDFEVSECDRPAIVTQCIWLSMEGAQQSLATNQPSSMVACIAELDNLIGMSAQPQKRP